MMLYGGHAVWHWVCSLRFSVDWNMDQQHGYEVLSFVVGFPVSCPTA